MPHHEHVQRRDLRLHPLLQLPDLHNIDPTSEPGECDSGQRTSSLKLLATRQEQGGRSPPSHIDIEFEASADHDRLASRAKLKAAQDASPFIFDFQSLALAWLPREDGVFLTGNPQNLVQAGTVSPVPFVTGDCDDEGTLFSLSTLNLTYLTSYLLGIR